MFLLFLVNQLHRYRDCLFSSVLSQQSLAFPGFQPQAHCINIWSTSFDLSLSLSGQSSRTVSSSPSIESLSGARGQPTASPPLPPSRGSEVSTSSPPLSATKKESFFNITRSRSHSKTMGKKESVSCSTCHVLHLPFLLFFPTVHMSLRLSLALSVRPSHFAFKSQLWPLRVCVCYQQEEDLEAQVSFLQGQINDLEAMSKYCAKMMNTHICEFSCRWSNLSAS